MDVKLWPTVRDGRPDHPGRGGRAGRSQVVVLALAASSLVGPGLVGPGLAGPGLATPTRAAAPGTRGEPIAGPPFESIAPNPPAPPSDPAANHAYANHAHTAHTAHTAPSSLALPASAQAIGSSRRTAAMLARARSSRLGGRSSTPSMRLPARSTSAPGPIPVASGSGDPGSPSPAFPASRP